MFVVKSISKFISVCGKGCSCETILLKKAGNWKAVLDNKVIMSTMFVDLCKVLTGYYIAHSLLTLLTC